MRKLLLVAAIAVFGLTTLNAQEVKIGIKGGLNFADVIGDNTEGLDVITAFHFGVMTEFMISDKFSFQPELLYSNQGYSLGSEDSDTVELDYLNLPLMGKYYLTKGLSLEAGPQIGVLLSGDYDELDVKDDFKNMDLSLNAGIGYKLNSGLNFSMRYNFGLTDIVNSDLSSFKNGVAQVSIGYFF
jgi:hypothetical protein